MRIVYRFAGVILCLYLILFGTIFSLLSQEGNSDPLQNNIEENKKTENEEPQYEQSLFLPKEIEDKVPYVPEEPKVPLQPNEEQRDYDEQSLFLPKEIEDKVPYVPEEPKRISNQTVKVDSDWNETVSEFEGWRPQRRLNDKGQPCNNPARDYKVWPIRVEGWFSGPKDACDVPCYGGVGGPIGTPEDADTLYYDVSESHSSVCTPLFSHTMENVNLKIEQNYHVRYDNLSTIFLKGTTSYESDFPLPYFSWAEYPIMYPYNKVKTASALVAAFISNCSPQKRLQWMDGLQSHNITVHSYGKCNNNIQLTRKSDWLGQKNELVKTYKFTFAFENSDANDYVTEKLFGPFVAGSIPLYDGARNVYEYVPSKKSAIYAYDFPSVKELAEYLLYLDENDTAYQEYLSWKEEGLSADFIAHSDIARVHSKCRLCIRTADLQRLDVGKQFVGNPWQQENEQAVKTRNPGSRMVRIRERGKFWLREIYVNPLTLTYDELNERILDRYKDQPHLLPIHSFYNLWDPKRKPIKTDEQVQKLFEDSYPEVEIIFQEPASTDRYSYSEWYYKKQGLPVPPISSPMTMEDHRN